MRKDGRVIPCRIITIDSSVIVYRPKPRAGEEYIFQRDVERVIRRSQPSTAPATVEIGADRDILYFSAGYGRGMPRGDFASQDLNSLASGLALPGNMLQFMVTYKPDPWIGMSVAYRHQDFRFNKSLITAELERQNPGISFRADIRPWRIAGLYGRLDVSIPLEKKRRWTFDIYGMAGLPYYNYPAFNITASANGFSAVLTERADPEKEPAFIAGSRLCFRPSASVILHLQADYLTGNATFQPVVSVGGTSQSYSYYQTFDAITVGFGVTIVVQKNSGR